MAPSIEPATCYVSGSTTTAVEQWRGRALPAAAVPAAKEQQAPSGGGHAPPRGFPRVPSLVFDIELEERSEGPRGSDDEQVGAKELKRWLMPSSTGEFKLRNDVELGLAQYYQQQRLQGAAASPVESNQLLASWLTKLGYKVSIRTALGGGEGYECLRNLRHVFLAVLPPGAHATTNRFVVDLSFKEQFRIAKPTPRYQSLLDCLPDTYVAPEASVAPLVNFMCHEMAQAFSTTGVVLPPWRQTMSMLSKWLPRKSLEEQVPRSSLVGPAANAGALHAIPAGGAVARRSTDMAGGQVHGHWAHASGTANTALQQQQQQLLPMEAKLAPAMGMLAGAGQQQQALGDVVMGLTRRQSSGPVVKPMSCEPQRVVVGGNFSTIGFA